MTRVVRSPRAKLDLYEIWSYVEEKSPRAADKLIDDITSTLEMLARHAGIGTPRPHVDPTARVFPVGKYVIIFRRIDDGIEVLRIAHSARDLSKLKLQ